MCWRHKWVTLAFGMRNRIQNAFLLALLALMGHAGWSQGCNAPLNLCQSDGVTAFDTYNGNLTPLPADLCFESSNTIFISFNTLSQTYITENSINFNGNAQVNISGLDCDTSQFGTPAIEAAVVAAGEPCIPNSYGDAFDCVPLSTGDFSLSLTGLLPDTIYYIIINTENIELGDPFNCDFNVQITGPAVQYSLDATANPLTIISGETSTLTSNSGFDSYEWSGPELESTNSQNTSVTLEEEGQEYVYNVTAEIDGCEVEDQVLVQVVPALTIPNTMTPNGDSFNDTWDIIGLDRFPDAEVRVYSRWGQLVFRTRGYDPWDGGELPEAVYYYVIDLNPLGFDTRPYTGYITIIR